MKKLTLFLLGVLSLGYFTSCSELEYPAEGSIADLTPPSASFGYTVDPGNYQKIAFSNFSISSTDYSWDLGNGETSTDKNPVMTYPDGRYLVTLTVSDKLNKTSTYSDSVIIIKPKSAYQPVIQNPGYDEVGDDSYRDFWRNGDLGGVIQITSSPVHDGVRSAKLPSTGDRIGYQEFTVEENTDYIVKFWYTMLSSPVGSLKVHILDGPVTDPATIDARSIFSETYTDQVDPNLYTEGVFEFNSGPSTKVAIYYTNKDVEARVDTWSIKVK
jgi:hypothetical protein